MTKVLATDFETLLSLWSKDRRAKGGWWALAGFSFQAAVYLLRFFEGIHNGAVSPRELAKTELLSDILVPSGGFYTLTQVKRTLDRPKLAAALREAYEIASLCDEEFLKKLRFCVACLICETPARPNDFKLQEVVGAAGDQHTWDRMLRCFDSINSITEEADPLDHLHEFLWHIGIRDTLAFVDGCLGRLLRLFYNPSQEIVTDIARELSRDFQFARATGAGPIPRVGRLLRKENFEPVPHSGSDREVLFDRRPQLRDFQLGRVRKRPEIFSELVREFERWWLAVSSSEEFFHVPTFWIDGRSGEGKSVFLLQLAQHILEGPQSPIVSFLGSPDEVPGWIKTQAELQRGISPSSYLPTIGIVDDLHLIGDRQKWENELRSATGLSSPRIAILACGPTLERTSFEAEYLTLIKVKNYSIPNLPAWEMREFSEWYAERTGKPAHARPTDVANRMLVIWIFELLQRSSLLEFAKSFKRRLEALELFDFARTIIACNILEIAAPAQLIDRLSDHQRDAFISLCAQSQLHFEEIRAGTSVISGYQLAHPQIAWQMYCHWASPSSTLAQQWGRDLAVALISTATDPNSITARSIVHRLVTTTRLEGEIFEELPLQFGCASHALSELYRKQTESLSIQNADGFLSTWLEVEFRKWTLPLNPSPITRAIKVAQEEPLRLAPSVAGWLWRISEYDEYSEMRHELRSAVESIISRPPDTRGLVSALQVIAGRSIDRGAGATLCKEWLKSNLAQPNVHGLLETLAKQGQHDDEVLHLAITWLKHNPNSPVAYTLISTLIAARKSDYGVRNIAVIWINNNLKNPQVYQPINSLISNWPTDAELRDLAVKWINNNLKHPQVYVPMTSLVAAWKSDKSLHELALTWIDNNLMHSKVYEPIKSLAAIKPTNERLRDLAVIWINDNLKHPQVYILVTPLVAAWKSDERLRDLAATWITDNPTDPRIHVLISTLVAAWNLDESVRDLAVVWINDNPTNPQVRIVISTLVAAWNTDKSVRDLAVTYINNNLKHLLVYTLITPLVAAWKSDESVRDVAMKWVGDNPAHLRVHEPIGTLVANWPADLNVLAVARRWLAANPKHSNVYQLLMTLIPRSGGAIEWVQLGEEFLNGGTTKERRTMLVALLFGKKAEKKYLELILAEIEAENDDKIRKFLLHSLRQALTNNVVNALHFLSGSSEPEYKKQAAWALAEGLRINPERAQEFVENISVCPANDVGFLLSACIASEMPGEQLCIVVRRWLNECRGEKDYGTVLTALNQNPARWRDISDLGGLSLLVQADYLTHRP